MKQRDVRLHRLFAAARTTAPADEASSMPGYLKGRVLAHWRAGVRVDETGRRLVRMCRAALVGATIVMLVSIAWSFSTHEPENDIALANYELRDALSTDVMMP